MEEPLNVLVLMDFSDALIERLRAVSPRLKITRKIVKNAGEIPADVWANVDVLYTGTILPEPDNAPRLRWIQAHSAGVDQLMTHPLLSAEDIILTTTSGIHATTIAEFTFAMIFALARKIPTMLRMAQKAEWTQDRLATLAPRELRGSTLGLVGYGSIGREVARIARAFGMEVLATKRNVMHPAMHNKYVEPGTGDVEGTMVDRLYPPEATRSMAALCDFLVVSAPLTNGTKALIDAEVLGAMKKSAYIVNIARGAVIDEEALIKALQTNQIAGAGLDVFIQEPLPPSSPFWKLDNVIISPHISGNTPRYHELAADVFAENLERYLSHRDLINRVDKKLGY